jgi:glycosyltransferase involved in cell wall biosynthesis
MSLFRNKTIGTIGYMGGILSVPEPFCWSWTQMIQYNKEYLATPGQDVFYTRATISFHVAARNYLVDNMMGDWLLMLDTDHVFEPDIAVRMLHMMNKHDVDVLTGLYQFRNAPHSPVLFTISDDGKTLSAIGDWDPGVELLQVGSAGGGCLMVRRKVYDRIRDELKCGPFDISYPFSEDHSFFFRLNTLGIKAYCALNIKANHLGYKEIGLDDYDKSILAMSERSMVEGRV